MRLHGRRLAGDLCVSSHKSTNESADPSFEPHSWLCAEIRLGVDMGPADTLSSRGLYELHKFGVMLVTLSYPKC